MLQQMTEELLFHKLQVHQVLVVLIADHHLLPSQIANDHLTLCLALIAAREVLMTILKDKDLAQLLKRAREQVLQFVLLRLTMIVAHLLLVLKYLSRIE